MFTLSTQLVQNPNNISAIDEEDLVVTDTTVPSHCKAKVGKRTCGNFLQTP